MQVTPHIRSPWGVNALVLPDVRAEERENSCKQALPVTYQTQRLCLIHWTLESTSKTQISLGGVIWDESATNLYGSSFYGGWVRASLDVRSFSRSGRSCELVKYKCTKCCISMWTMWLVKSPLYFSMLRYSGFHSTTCLICQAIVNSLQVCSKESGYYVFTTYTCWYSSSWYLSIGKAWWKITILPIA